MWKKLQEAIAKNKIAVFCVALIILAVVVAVPLLIKQDDVPADSQQTEQQGEDLLTANAAESSKEDSKESQNKSEVKPNKDKSFIGKVIDFITGNDDEDEANGDKDNSGSGTPEQPSGTDRNVVLVSNGGTDLGAKTVAVGTLISSLPTPYKEGYIFVGWCYDEAGKQPVESNATVSKDMTLYASYAQAAPLETIDSKTFASAQNVNPDFSIKVVTEDKALDAATVLAGIEADNLTDPEQKNFIKVSGSKGIFTITGSDPVGEDVDLPSGEGFAEGTTFRIKLTDSRLNFKDEPESVREFNFTTDMEEVLNVSYKEDVIFISTEDLKNITNEGETVEALSIALYSADTDGKIGPAELTEGTFEYNRGELKEGMIVCVYAGVRPDLRTLETPVEQCGDVAYVEITQRNNNVYSYKNADAEDVIFEPDMLPVSVDADQDGDTENQSITVDDKKFDYSADVYENIELDSQTTVDIGDFLMFYTGTFGVETGEDAAQLLGVYGKITKVTENGDGTTTVAYTDVGWEEVQAAMDMFASQTMSGEEMLEGVDTEELEADIEQQAIDSGFADEAAQYLASLTLATENFTKLDENMNLEDYKVTLEDGTPVSPEELQLMDSSIKVKSELEAGYPKVRISIVPRHLGDAQGTEASGQGLSIELEIKVNITISKSGSDNSIVITVSGKFVEEVGIDLGAKSKAIWKVWGIFPYIAEYRVTANVDVLNYTGIEVNATMVTKEAGEEEGNKESEGEDVAELIKGLLQEKEENGEDENSEETSNKLVKHYSEMLQEESDYLKIVDESLYEQEKQITPMMPIIAIEFSVDFVVELEACVSIGFDFEYMTGKRYTYAVDVFGRKVKCDTVVLLEEQYEFCFYAMGRLGIRAGIEIEFKVGLFSTKLDSVGINAGAGAYTKLWGYFYYELRYAASQGRSQSYSGAMLVEVGAFMEVGLSAQVLDGTFSKEFEILDKEWPLWMAGNADNVLDFSTAQEDMPEIKLKQYIRSTAIPDSTFKLTYLDLQEGEEKQAVYNEYYDENGAEGASNRRNFIITMTNDKFTYDPQTNTISVNPDKDDKKLEGEMIITWVKYPLSFTSKPIQRTISLYWDNLRDGYVIVPYTNGGSYMPIIEAKYEAKVNVPADPEKLGYNFEGWYSDEELTIPYTFPETMPAEDAEIYAKWSPCVDTSYRVEHYQENLRSGQYDLFEAEDFQGTTDSYVTPEVKSYTGFKSPAKQEVKILADGSTVLRYYYDLEWHTVTFDPGEVGGESVVYDLKYGGTVYAPGFAAAGYTFAGWDKEVVDTMGIEDVTYTAQWTKNPDTAYRVEYYVQQTDGSYTLQHLIEEQGYTGASVAAADLRQRIVDSKYILTADEKYIEDNAVVFDSMTVRGISCESAEIEASGKLIIKINYKRIPHKATFDFGYDGKAISYDAYCGEILDVPVATRAGYEFKGWSIDGTTVVTPADTMGTEDVTYRALWTPNTCTIVFDKNNAAASGEMSSMQVTYDAAQTLPVNGFTVEGYSFAGWATVKGGGVQYANGANVSSLAEKNSATVTLYAVWKPAEYAITYNNCEDAGNANPMGYTVENATITLSAPAKTGYDFGGWYDNPDFNGEAVTIIPKGSSGNVTLYAKWTAAAIIPDTYSVMFYVNGGSVTAGSTETRTVTGDGTYGELATLTKKGYTFDGWFTSAEGGTEITADTSVTIAENHILYAHFSPVTYTITYNGVAGASHSNPEAYNAQTGAVTLTAATKPGYTFEGWYAEADFSGGEVKVIPVDSAENMKLYAKWEENAYKVIFHSNNGSGITSTQNFKYSESKALNANDFTRNCYLFGGWALETAPYAVKYTDGQTVSKLSAEADGEVHLYAVWNHKGYDIVYKNMEGLENSEDNPVIFNEQNNVITLHDPKERTGYTFGGWYTDAAFADPVTDSLTLTDYRTWTFYAKWIPNSYTVTFDSCLGDTVPTETLLMTYDEPENLLLLEDVTSSEKPGYTFKGWSTTKGGNVEYTDGQNVINIASQGNITLYAVWELNIFTITYDVGTGAVTHTNPATYSIEDNDVVFTAPVAKDGYQFLGWYEGDTLVKEIVKGTQRDYALTAKWAHGGEFSIAYTSSASKDYGYELTYTVTRTLPEGTVATTNPQNVYYRTVNGTAYGSTAGYMANNDSYHFGHVGGEDVFLTFGPTDFEKTFVVQDWGAYAGSDMAASYNIGSVDRYFHVELYKVLDTVGTCQGKLGAEKSVKRTIGAMTDYTLTNALYNWKTGTVASGEVTVNDEGYENNTSYTTKPLSVLGLEYREQLYAAKTATGAGFYATFDVIEEDDGYQRVRFSIGGQTKGEYVFATKDGEKATNWREDRTFPTTGAAQGDVIFSGGDCFVSNSWTVVSGTPMYAKVGLGDTIKIEFDASGSKEDDWRHKDLRAYYKVLDTRAPQQVGIAPMAFAQYKAGDTISITVIYNEVINSVSGVGLGTINGLPINNVQYVAGTGTNALTFKATVTSDFEITPTLNNSLVTLKPVTGTVKDILGNQ